MSKNILAIEQIVADAREKLLKKNNNGYQTVIDNGVLDTHLDMVLRIAAAREPDPEVQDARRNLEVCLTRCTRGYCIRINGVQFGVKSPLCDMAIGFVRTLMQKCGDA